MKIIKSDWRSSLTPKTLDSLMRIVIDGPDIDTFDPSRSVKLFLTSGQRQRRPNLENLNQSHLIQRFISSSETSTFKFEDLEIELARPSRKLAKPCKDSLQSGKQFCDHMLEIKWNESKGWQKPVISPIKNFSIHPAAKVFHYAVELFESMKAYKGCDNKIRLFRPSLNMERMNSSAKKSSLPTFSGDELIKCMSKLVSIDKDWLLQTNFSSLYVRPAMIGTEPTIGIGMSKEAKLFIITSPVSEGSASGVKSISVLADPQFVKAFPGGVGFTIMGSNYAPTIAIQNIVESQGCDQFLWLYGDNHQLKEIGSMNAFVYLINKDGGIFTIFFSEKELVTPPLDGTVLPGITRNSLLLLSENWKEFKISERSITMAEILCALQEKKLLEIFGTGTENGICSVEQISYADQLFRIPAVKSEEPLSTRFLKALTDIQTVAHQQVQKVHQHAAGHNTLPHRQLEVLRLYVCFFCEKTGGTGGTGGTGDLRSVCTFDIGKVLSDAFDNKNDSDAMCLARTAQIIRTDMFQELFSFNGSFSSKCQEKSLSLVLIAMLIVVNKSSLVFPFSIVIKKEDVCELTNLSHNCVTKKFVSNAAASTFKFKNLEIELVSPTQRLAKPSGDDLKFGQQFSDHMLQIKWSDSKGWHHPIISPIQNFSIHPAAKVFHYASELFEGMKAYKGVDNKIRLFRPSLNMERMNTSAKRASLPTFDGKELIKCISKLVSIDKDWVPETDFSSLYIRPTIIGTEPSLGVATSKEAILYVLTGPVGSYFATGSKPVSLLADPQFVRAFYGGAGFTKMGSNYAPTIAVQKHAESLGHQQVLWLYGEDHQLTEVGTMNIFMFLINKDGVFLTWDIAYCLYWYQYIMVYFLIHYKSTIYLGNGGKGNGVEILAPIHPPLPNESELTAFTKDWWRILKKELVTPPLDGIILPGVTRNSLLAMARSWNEFKTTERKITMNELTCALKENRLLEIFGAGTACVVCPIAEISYAGQLLKIPSSKSEKPLSSRFLTELTDIQYGKVKKNDWTLEID
ncbi:Branched-chain-amino-acid aminotransferase, mitochondrial [Nymphon striatum]|nr:Branched-chain-amino-acid aminotransferase, mitochondrial [Nymphon striatum]